MFICSDFLSCYNDIKYNMSIAQSVIAGRMDVDTFINPTMTFWQTAYERHTPFAMEPRPVEFVGQTGWGRTAKVTLPRNGDLVSKVYLVVDLPAIGFLPTGGWGTEQGLTSADPLNATGQTSGLRYVNDIGRAILDDVKLEIGSVTFDRLYPELENAFEAITDSESARSHELTGRVPYEENVQNRGAWDVTQNAASISPMFTEMTRQLRANADFLNTRARGVQRVYVPLTFWFTSEWGVAIPVIALYLTDVNISVKFKQFNQVVNDALSPVYNSGSAEPFKYADVAGTAYAGNKNYSGRDYYARTAIAPTAMGNVFLLAETIFLGDEERQWFVNRSLKYHITQNQSVGSVSIPADARTARVDLILNHPVSELIFFIRTGTALMDKNYFDFGPVLASTATALIGRKSHQESFETLSLSLNGNDRLKDIDAAYFRMIQNRNHHSTIPHRNIYTYSYALNPEDSGPSGSLNFSKLDNVRMTFTFAPGQIGVESEIMIYAKNMNISTVASGVQLLRFAS